MTELLIAAAGGLAREVMATVREGNQYDILGLVDDDPAKSGTILDGAHVVGPLEEVRSFPAAHIVVCLCDGTVRLDVVRRLGLLGMDSDRFATVIHPSASIPEGCYVGEGSIILAGVVMTAAVQLGRHVIAMPHVTFGHGDLVEDFATVGAAASLGGSVVVGRAASLGMNCSIRQDLQIGAAAVIGMGAAVVTDVPDGQVWAGVPARQLLRPPRPGLSANGQGEGRR